ncbi:MAG: hypothetical protein HW395_767 [candidate division NC10 bacterium]|nr:hypothetical protein [candidate division NC10 bacterium]
MTHPLAASLLILSLASTGCAHLIEWGWDEPDQTFLKTHIAKMERKPFDGVVLHLTVPGISADLANFSWHLADHGYRWEDLQPAIEELKAVPFRRFRHNFLRINLNSTDRPLDLLDDAAWETVLANLRLAGRIARDGGLRGFMVDPEAYAARDPEDGRPRFNVFDYDRRAVREASFGVYRSAALRRGRESAAILGDAAPDLVLLFAFAYSFPCYSSKPQGEQAYGLLPAFVDGILVAKPREMMVVEGHEPSYPYRYCHQFQEAYRRLRAECRRLSSVPQRYDDELRIGFGIWIDNQSGQPCESYRKKGRPCPWADPNLHPEEARHRVDPKVFEEAVASALDITDRYVWIYSEEPKWWTSARPEGENLPAEFVQAIVQAEEAALARKGSICQGPRGND